jgi:hypothetical protein
MILDGLSEDTSPSERIAILREMDRQGDTLMDSLQVDNQDETKAVDFLKQRPEISIQDSRLSVD